MHQYFIDSFSGDDTRHSKTHFIIRQYWKKYGGFNGVGNPKYTYFEDAYRKALKVGATEETYLMVIEVTDDNELPRCCVK